MCCGQWTVTLPFLFIFILVLVSLLSSISMVLKGRANHRSTHVYMATIHRSWSYLHPCHPDINAFGPTVLPLSCLFCPHCLSLYCSVGPRKSQRESGPSLDQSIFVQMTKCICPNGKISLSEWQNVFVSLSLLSVLVLLSRTKRPIGNLDPSVPSSLDQKEQPLNIQWILSKYTRIFPLICNAYFPL